MLGSVDRNNYPVGETPNAIVGDLSSIHLRRPIIPLYTV
jgi:hypothetical protein